MGYKELQEKAENIQRAVYEASILIGEKKGVKQDGYDFESGLDMNVYADLLSEMSVRLSDSMFKTLFMGTFKNGKSTAINAILGRELLPAKATAATAVISQVVYGTDKDHVRIFRSGNAEPEIVTLDEFFREFQLTEEDEALIDETGSLSRFADIDYVLMESDYEMFKDGVQFIDSPGLEEAMSRTKTTERFVPKANAVVFVLDATKPFSDKEKSYIRNHFVYADPKPRNVFFIINRINQLNTDKDREDVKKSAFRHLSPVFTDESGNLNEDLYYKRVFCVNAYQALLDRKAGKQPTGTGMLEFQAALEAFLTSDDRVLARYQTTLANMACIYEEINEKKEKTAKVLQKPLEEIEANSKIAHEKLKQISSDVDFIKQFIDQTEKVVETKVFADLNQFLDVALPEQWKLHMEDFDNKFSITDTMKLAFTKDESKRNEILKPLMKFLKEFISDAFTQWSKSVKILIRPELNDLQKTVEQRIEKAMIELNEANDIFSGEKFLGAKDTGRRNKIRIALDVVNDTIIESCNISSSEYRGDLAGNIVLLGLGTVGLFLTGPVLPIIMMSFGGLHLVTGPAAMKDKMLESIETSVIPEVAAELKKKKTGIGENIKQQFEIYKNALSKNIEGVIADENKYQEDILRQLRDTVDNGKSEIARIEQIESAFFDKINCIYQLLYGQNLELQNVEKLAALIKSENI